LGDRPGAAVGALVPQPGRLHEHATALRRAASMAIWQCDALVHASYTAKLPGPVPQGELTLNAIEHFPWAAVSHAIAEAAVGCAVGDSDGASEGAAVGCAVGDSDGASEGAAVGCAVGDSDGASEGAAVGCAVGDPVRSAWNTFGSPAELSLYTVGYKHVANRAQRLTALPL
jgi:hypothetical protein